MLIRSLVSIVVVASSFILVMGQTPDAKKENAEKAENTTWVVPSEKLRTLPFPTGVPLQFLIKELARDMDLNVLFDGESRLESRVVRIDIKNVTPADALNSILLQEGLISEESGPKTILVAHPLRARSIPQIGLGVTPLTAQLAEYFGVKAGLLINNVQRDSAGSKAGLKAGDVIVGMDGEPERGILYMNRAIADKKDSDVTLKIVRDRKEQTVSVTPEKMIK